MRNPKMRGFTAALLVSAVAGCSPVQFTAKNSSGDNGNNDGGDPVIMNGNINCSLSLDNNLTSKSVASAAQNPVVKASCTPSSVTYNWQVKKNNTAITINGLSGSSSTADFFSAGNGTYSIHLNATRTGMNAYNSPSPLTVTVNSATTSLPQITCTAKLNSNATEVTVTQGSGNPQLTGSCTPADSSYVWTVTRNNTAVVIPGLSGSQSTPDFSSQAAGTYLITLQANRNGYQPFTLGAPLRVIVQERPTRSVTTTKAVSVSDNQLDVVLIIDDSKSMLADNQRLAARLQGFTTDLSNAGFDWQMCATLTRAQQISSSDPTLYWGASRYWIGTSSAPPYLLKPSSGNISQIVSNTINHIGAGWAGTDDERAIKAAYWHLWNGDPAYQGASGCYRAGAGLAVIILSDEDERSVGGDSSQVYYSTELKPLEEDDLPATYVKLVKDTFGTQKRFTVNSIIVRPGDSQCMAQQDAEGAKSHYGHKYAELSQLTGGHVGSICDSDYSQNLKYFKDKIVSDMASLPLECAPLGPVTVQVSPSMTYTTRVEGSSLIFTPRVPAGRTINATYSCPQ